MQWHVKQGLSYKCDKSSPEFLLPGAKKLLSLEFVAGNIVTLFCFVSIKYEQVSEKKEYKSHTPVFAFNLL